MFSMSSQQNDNLAREQKASAQAQFFQSPWSDTTQKVRNRLLLVSVVGILMGAVGIFPKEITALGLKVEDINQRALLIIWAIVDAYFTITLIFYAYSDFMRVYWSEFFKIEFRELPQDDTARELVLDRLKVEARLKSVHEMRLLLDLLIPVLSGIAAFGFLLWRIFKI
jgi:hypothetical protein